MKKSKEEAERMKEFGKKIREHREMLGWSQEQLSNFCGHKPYQTSARWERGATRPGYKDKELLAEFLAYPPGTKYVSEGKVKFPDGPKNLPKKELTAQEMDEMDRLALQTITQSLAAAYKLRQSPAALTDKSLELELIAAADAHLQRLNQTQLGETALRATALVLANALRRVVDSLTPEGFAAVKAGSAEIGRQSQDSKQNSVVPQKR